MTVGAKRKTGKTKGRTGTRRRRGRPDKLTPETQDRIVKMLLAGNYLETAAAAAGITKSTLYEWLRRGTRVRNGEVPPSKQSAFDKRASVFSDAVEKAAAQAEALMVQRITVASEEDWRAAAWRLERRHPDRWGRKRLDVTSDGEPLEGSPLFIMVEGDADADPFITDSPDEFDRRSKGTAGGAE